MTLDPDLAALAHRIFAAQPFTRLLGAELAGVGPDWAEIRLRNRPDLRQQHGYLHGGVIGYLADNALTFAGGLALGGDALTAEYKINYLRPAVGDLVTARATTTAATRRQAVCTCTVHAAGPDGPRLIALAQGTIVPAGPPPEARAG